MAVKAPLVSPPLADEPLRFTMLSYEQRRLLMKKRQEAVQKKRLIELLQAQRVARELFERVQSERKRRIEEMRRREDERRKAVLARREKLLVSYKEKAEQLVKKQMEREVARVRQPISLPSNKHSFRMSPSPSDTSDNSTSCSQPPIKREYSMPTIRSNKASSSPKSPSSPCQGGRQPIATSKSCSPKQLGSEKARGVKRAHSPVKSQSGASRTLMMPLDGSPVASSKQQQFTLSNLGNAAARLAQQSDLKLSKTGHNQMPTIVTLQQVRRTIPASASLQKLSASRNQNSSASRGIPKSSSLQFTVQSFGSRVSGSKLGSNDTKGAPMEQPPVVIPVIRPRFRSESQTAVSISSEERALRTRSADLSHVSLDSVIVTEDAHMREVHGEASDSVGSGVNQQIGGVGTEMNKPNARVSFNVSEKQREAEAECQENKPVEHREDGNDKQHSVQNADVLDGERVERKRRLELIMSRVNRQSGAHTPSSIDSPANLPQTAAASSKHSAHSQPSAEVLMAASCIEPAESSAAAEANGCSMSISFSGSSSAMFSQAKRPLSGLSSFKSPLLQSLFERTDSHGAEASTQGSNDSDIRRRLPRLLKSLSQSKSSIGSISAAVASDVTASEAVHSCDASPHSSLGSDHLLLLDTDKQCAFAVPHHGNHLNQEELPTLRSDSQQSMLVPKCSKLT